MRKSKLNSAYRWVRIVIVVALILFVVVRVMNPM